MRTVLRIVAIASLLCQLALADGLTPRVNAVRVPDGGIQPQIAVGGDGTIHLVYYRGEGAAGDLFYVQSTDNGETFSPAMRVNSQNQSAIAAGTIRGAHLALGRNDRVHVAWNGSGKAEPKGPANPDLPKDSPYRYSSPMLYARMNDPGTAFEAERNLMKHTYSLDGGGSIAADNSGHVYVVWHANSLRDDSRGEAARSVWVATSTNDGKTFAAEARANPDPTGACGCCGLRAHADTHGNLFVLYRSAEDTFNRDMRLLVSRDHGKSFSARLLDPWKIGQCVMSSAGLFSTKEAVFAAWETEAQVKFARIDKLTASLVPPDMIVPDANSSSRKHPVLAENSAGQLILVWAEGTGWAKGGNVAWQIFDKAGKPVPGGAGLVEGVPVWSFAAGYSRRDGGFTIVY